MGWAMLSARLFQIMVIDSEQYKQQGITQAQKNEKLLAFCGLANPKKFYLTLNENGYNIALTQSFPDHYFYNFQDINIHLTMRRCYAVDGC